MRRSGRVDRCNTGFIGRKLAFSSILLVPTRDSILPGRISLSARLAGGVGLGVPLVASTVSAMARSNVTVTVTHRNNVNMVRGGVAVRSRTARISGIGESRGNIVASPFFLSPRGATLSTRGLVHGCEVDNIPVYRGSNALINVLAGESVEFVDSCSIGVTSIVAPGSGLMANITNVALRRTGGILVTSGIRGLPLISGGKGLANLMAVGSVRGDFGCPGATHSTGSELLYTTTVNMAGSVLSETGTLTSTRMSTLVLSSTRNRSGGVLGTIRAIGGTFPRVSLVTNGITATRNARTLVGTNTSTIGINVNPNSVYAAHIITNVNIPRVATVCSDTRVTSGCNVPVVTSNNVGCDNRVIGTVTTNNDIIVMNSLITNYRRSPKSARVCRNHRFGICHNVNSLNTVGGNSTSECFRGNAGGFIPRNIRNHIPCGKPMNSAMFRVVNNLHSNVNCINYRDVRRLHAGTGFVGVANTNLIRDRPRSICVAGRTPGCSNDGRS